MVRHGAAISGVLCVLAGVATAQPVQFASGPGATGKWYERVFTTGQLSWDQAQSLASGMTFNGTPGRLLVLDGPDPLAEELWVRDNVVLAAPRPATSLYWFGARRFGTAGVPQQNWVWTTGASVPTSVTQTWVIDYFEGPNATYGAVFAVNYSADYGDYRVDDPAFRMGGFIVEFPASSTSPCDPDVNQDGVADQGDVDYLINVIAGGENPTGIDADFNQDGVADQGDIDALINVIAGGACP
ncbi:MAG: hypothetical protein GC200_04750 [Tepidisphaera sp.]|nr:hypothetical protein [Tepidisphaera sp.]